MKVKKRVMVRSHLVIRAILWLKENNKLYKDVQTPKPEDLPTPIIVDNQEGTEESEDAVIENKIDVTVLFPDTKEPNSVNAGLANINEPQKTMLELYKKSSMTDYELHSRPSSVMLRDYVGDNLLKAFPLQFPYGHGGFSSLTNKKMAFPTYCDHVHRLSLPQMHKPDFILILHNMFERDKILKSAVWKCNSKHKMNDPTLGQNFGVMSTLDLKRAVNMCHNGVVCGHGVASQFLKSITSVCKSMCHSNEAAKEARQKMFSMINKFGLPAVFLTVTPDDSNIFRIKVFADPSNFHDGSGISLTEADCTLDQELREKLRTEFPGLSAFDFESVIEIVIEKIIGWDSSSHCATKKGGIFGIPLGFCGAVEEQVRKTLHVHILLFILGWMELLKKLYACNLSKTVPQATSELKECVESIVSTKLHDESMTQNLFKHKCKDGVESSANVSSVSPQQLRNLRHKDIAETSVQRKILECNVCKHGFASEELVQKVLQCPEMELPPNMTFPDGAGSDGIECAMSQCESLFRRCDTVFDIKRHNFLVNARYNHHYSRHAKMSCFKKGKECRFHKPELPSESTRICFDDSLTDWHTWHGVNVSRCLFDVTLKRSPLDVFMNNYSPTISSVFKCNSNIAVGLDGCSVIYVTSYTSKGTQEDDRAPHTKVMKTIANRIEKQEELQDGNAVDFPGKEGLKRLLGAVLATTSAHIVSAPMAWHLISNKSRFLFSHDFQYFSLQDFKTLLKTNLSLHT